MAPSPTHSAIPTIWDGRRSQITLPDGRTVGYNYNPNSSLNKVTLAGSWSTPGKVTYGYQGSGATTSHLPNQITYPNNVTATLGYDSNLRLTKLDYTTTGASTDLMQFDYTYDAYGNRNTATELLPEAAPHYQPETDTIGIMRNDSVYYLRRSNSAGNPDLTVDLTTYTGGTGSNVLPIAGDWTGAGFDTVGFYKPNGAFILCTQDSTSACAQSSNIVQATFGNGSATDTPLSGHWFAGMLHDGLGVSRASNGLVFFFKGTVTTGSADATETLGSPGDVPITGNWQGSAGQGNESPAIYRPSAGQFFVSYAISNTATTNVSFYFGPTGSTGYVPLAGNWTGSPSGAGVGLFNNATGTFYLKNQLTNGAADSTFVFGSPGDQPVAGNWPSPPPQKPASAPQPTPQGGSVPGGNQIGGSDVQPILPNPPNQNEPVLFQPPILDQAQTPPSLLKRVINYSYDGLNRLTGAAYTDNSTPTFNYQYTYDFNSNRTFALGQNFLSATNPTFQATNSSYNLANQLTTSTDQNGTTTYTYNADGTLAGQVTNNAYNPNAPNTTTSYAYDLADRLTNVTSPNGSTTGYTYDGMGDRVSASTHTGSTSTYTTYLVDPSGSIPQILAEYPNSGLPTYYIPAGTLIGQDSGTSSGLSYFATDGLGSVRSLLGGSGSTSGLIDYDPYGSTLPDTGASGINSHIGYTGAMTDANGLVYLNARYYDPGLGDFLSSDPLAGKVADPGSFNLYGYVKGTPINLADRSGKDPDIDPCEEDPEACIPEDLLPILQWEDYGGFVPGEEDPITEVADYVSNYILTTENIVNDVSAAIHAQDEAEPTYARQYLKLDVFGGIHSKIPGAINVDIIAESGMMADATQLSEKFAENSVDEIVMSNPHPEVDKSLVLEDGKLITKTEQTRIKIYSEAAKVLKPGGILTVNSSLANPFKPDINELSKLGFKLVSSGPLASEFQGMTFYRTNGTAFKSTDLVTWVFVKE